MKPLVIIMLGIIGHLWSQKEALASSHERNGEQDPVPMVSIHLQGATLVMPLYTWDVTLEVLFGEAEREHQLHLEALEHSEAQEEEGDTILLLRKV